MKSHTTGGPIIVAFVQFENIVPRILIQLHCVNYKLNLILTFCLGFIVFVDREIRVHFIVLFMWRLNRVKVKVKFKVKGLKSNVKVKGFKKQGQGHGV